LELSDKLLRAFTEVIRSNKPKEKKQNPTVMGTVVKNGLNIGVIIDGSTITTPAKTLVGVEDGDRVDVVIQNHKAVITGNHTNNAITRFGDVYITMSQDGVIVGKLDDQEQPTGASILIDPTAGVFRVVDADGYRLAEFGTTAQIGRDDTPHSITTDQDFRIIDANGNVLAVLGPLSKVKALDIEPDDGEYAILNVTAKDDQGNIAVSGRVTAAIGSRRFGLYDNRQETWLVYSDHSGNIYNRTTPIQLYSGSATPAQVSDTETYTNVNVSNLSRWNVIFARARVGGTYQNLTFVRGMPTELFLTHYNNGRLIRGGFKVDWANNRMQLRCVSGNSDDYQYVILYSVYGIVSN